MLPVLKFWMGSEAPRNAFSLSRWYIANNQNVKSSSKTVQLVLVVLLAVVIVWGTIFYLRERQRRKEIKRRRLGANPADQR